MVKPRNHLLEKLCPSFALPETLSKETERSLFTCSNQEAVAKISILLLDRNVGPSCIVCLHMCTCVVCERVCMLKTLCTQENDIPLPLLLDFHGWTGNAMGHESDGHNFFQVQMFLASLFSSRSDVGESLTE